MRIFLSYASEDKDTADKIYLSLVKRHKVFFDHTGLKSGHDFDDKIREEVKKCELFIFLISPHSVVKSSYALTELLFAREKWNHPEGHVLPVMISETNYDLIPPYLKAVTILEPEGNIVAEVRARVENWEQDGLKSRVGIIKLISFGGAILALAVIVFAVLKFSGLNSGNDVNNNQPNKSTPTPLNINQISGNNYPSPNTNQALVNTAPSTNNSITPIKIPTKRPIVTVTKKPIVTVTKKPQETPCDIYTDCK